MSYSILYNTQFLKSKEGITPVVLMGDNNVWEGSRQHDRRVRSWSCFSAMIGASERELMDLAESFTGGTYQEHWKNTNGKWVNDAGLMRWMKNNIKRAASIEDVLLYNRSFSIPCHLSVWEKQTYDQHNELSEDVGTTEELDNWIRKAKERIAELRKQGFTVFPIIRFYSEKLVHPAPHDAKKPEKVILRHGKSYLYQYFAGRTSSWSHDIQTAMEFSYEEALALKEKEGRYGWIAEAVLVSADAKKAPYNAIICLQDKFSGHKVYVSQRTSRRIRMSGSEKGAYRYRDEKAAERALKGMENILSQNGYTGSVELLPIKP